MQISAWPQLQTVDCVNVQHIQTRELQMFYCRGLLIMTEAQLWFRFMNLLGPATGIWCDYDGEASPDKKWTEQWVITTAREEHVKLLKETLVLKSRSCGSPENKSYPQNHDHHWQIIHKPLMWCFKPTATGNHFYCHYFNSRTQWQLHLKSLVIIIRIQNFAILFKNYNFLYLLSTMH